MKWFLSAACGCLVWSVVPHSLAQETTAPGPPSFDCVKARGRIEKLICGEPNLAALDRRVADLFAVALSQAIDASDVKREQRRWLGDRDDCKESACLARTYEARLAQLTTQTGKFTQAQARAICEAFIQPQSRAEALAARAGAEDINNDGRAERASQCSGGTANIPCVEYVDADGKPLSVLPLGFDWSSYAASGRSSFRAGDRTFTYHSLDAALEQPAYISYVTPSNRETRVCDFDTVIGSAVLEGGEEVCAAVEASDDRIEAFELAALTDPARFAVDRPDTRPHALGTLDIDNDGLEENLIEYVYSSGAGRGCEINYFELLSEETAAPAQNSNAAAVRELQGLAASGAGGRNCGVLRNRVFRFGDKVYLETNAMNAENAPHEVRLLRGEAVATVCTFEQQIRSRLKTLY